MGFIRFLFFLLIGYYLLKIIGRLVAPLLFKYASRKSQDMFRRAYEQQQARTHSTHNTGDVILEKPQKSTRKSAKPVGEYISFEEIE